MSFLKQKVFKSVLLILLASFVEVIHVKLPNKRSVIIMSKVNWKDCIGKLFGFLHDEPLTVSCP